MIERYDENNDGVLDRKEVRRLLIDISPHHNVTQDELAFVFKIANATGDGYFKASEMCKLLSCWHNYQSSRPEIELHFLKHDPEGTGRLDRKQLKCLLEELSGARSDAIQGQHYIVTPSEVEWVMKQASVLKRDYLTKPELRRALALWQVQVQNQQIACCTVM